MLRTFAASARRRSGVELVNGRAWHADCRNGGSALLLRHAKALHLMRNNNRKGRSGSALVECVIVLPVLVLLIGGIVDFGARLNAAVRLSNAAQAGALYGAQSNALASDTAGIRNAVLRDASGLQRLTVASSRVCRCPSGNAETGAVSCTAQCPNYGPPRVYVRVTATATVPVVVLRPLLGSAGTLNRTVEYRSQ